MNRFHWLRGLRPAALGALVFAAACQEDGLNAPRTAVEPSLAVRLEASSLSAAPGARVAVGVRAETGALEGLGGLQGRVRFNPVRLRYVGQAEGGGIVMVNDERAATGEVRLASVSGVGLPPRTAVLVFEVREAGYAGGLSYVLDAAATRRAERIRSVDVARQVSLATDLPVPVAERLTLGEWAAKYHPTRVGGPQRTPGQYVLNLRFGDATLDGTLDVLDAADIANTAVGNNAIIVGTDAPSVDRVVAANVAPANTPGLGEPGDAVPPGQEANGTRVIDVLDAVAVANKVVGNPADIAGDLIPGRGPLATNRVIVTADILANTTWTRDNIYEIQGVINVDGGATLTIEAGTRVEGQQDTTLTPNGEKSSLFVNRNGRIVADGTALQPILFTCTGVKAKGCWGGIWIAGNAPINNLDNQRTLTSPVIAGRAPTGGCLEAPGEGGATTYGGCNADDSSGVLRYIVEEYSGKRVAANNELNGISMGGVGRRTVVEFIQVHAGLDDGLELFGGTVNVRYLYSTGNSDDSFDICCGWAGNAQFIVIQHDSTDADKGIEADNAEVAAQYENGPFTTGQVWNLTFVGRLGLSASVPPTGTPPNNSNDAFHLRRGTSPSIRNAMVINPRSGLDLDDAATCTNAGGSGIASIQNSLFAGYFDLGNIDAGAPTNDVSCSTPGGTATDEPSFITMSGNQTHVSSAGILTSPFSQTLPDFRPLATLPGGVSVNGGTPPGPSNNFTFDVTATYIGAVPQANSTGSNVPWYSGWTRGF